MSFKVGDVCIAVRPLFHPGMSGTECTVLWRGLITYGIRLSTTGDVLSAFPFQLRRKPPKDTYDGTQVVSWIDCPWQPHREHA
jgi:hypothetical protein